MNTLDMIYFANVEEANCANTTKKLNVIDNASSRRETRGG